MYVPDCDYVVYLSGVDINHQTKWDGSPFPGEVTGKFMAAMNCDMPLSKENNIIPPVVRHINHI